MFVGKMLADPGLYTVVRKTLPALRASAYRDFLEIIKDCDLYDQHNHNKSDLIYRLRSSEIEFISVDQSDKIKGRKRKHLFINEANELSYDNFIQLALRTTGQIYLDLNPSHDKYHWIETKIRTRNDVEVIHSTYLDNPFLPDETRREIERLRDADPNLWRIYGLGQMGVLENIIYNHWRLCDKLPEGEEVYGLDFGFNNPSALVRVVINDDDIYLQEVIYETKLTNQDLINKMTALEVSKNTVMYADSAEPQRIEEIRQAGFNVLSSDKDVKKGIDTLKSKRLFVSKDSVNLQKELRAYKWKEKEGQPIDEPVKFNDHLLDATRYAVHTHLHHGVFVGFV